MRKLSKRYQPKHCHSNNEPPNRQAFADQPQGGSGGRREEEASTQQRSAPSGMSQDQPNSLNTDQQEAVVSEQCSPSKRSTKLLYASSKADYD